MTPFMNIVHSQIFHLSSFTTLPLIFSHLLLCESAEHQLTAYLQLDKLSLKKTVEAPLLLADNSPLNLSLLRFYDVSQQMSSKQETEKQK